MIRTAYAPVLVAAMVALVVTGCGERQSDPALLAISQRLDAIESRLTNDKANLAGHGAARDPRQQPATAMAQLLSGHAAFLQGSPRTADLSSKRRQELSTGQKPYAVIVGCSDSRCPPEHVFGAGMGDLFVVRNAGNVIPDESLASVEYAVAHLGSRLIVCIGHTHCGAVKAAVANNRETPAVAELVDRIAPAVSVARGEGYDGAALVARSVVVNAFRTRDELLSRSALLKAKVASGDVVMVVARQQLDDGRVDWLDAGGLAGVPMPPSDALASKPASSGSVEAPMKASAALAPASGPAAHAHAAGDHSHAPAPAAAKTSAHDHAPAPAAEPARTAPAAILHH